MPTIGFNSLPSPFSLPTEVNGGKLLVNGQLGNTAVAVNASGLLGGSGTILGGVTVASSGTLSPGNSPGVLTVGSLSLSDGSHTLMEITAMVIAGLACGGWQMWRRRRRRGSAPTLAA